MNKEELTQIAIDLATKGGLINLTRLQLCEYAGISDGSFPHIMECTFAELVEQLRSDFDEDVRPVVRTRATNPELRKDQILGVAINLSKARGYHKLTREAIAFQADISPSLVSKYFNTMKQLRRAIMRAAVKKQIPEIIAQGLANDDDQAKKAPQELKLKAIELIVNR